MFRWMCCGVVILLGVSAASAAAPKDVAEVFPPTTLAYAELHNPPELGPHLAALFKRTPFEDSIPFIHGKKNDAKTLPELHGKQRLAELALLVSPEVLAEFRKLGGVAVALVDFNDRGEPEVALAVLTGDSAAAGLAARAFVTMTSSVRKVAEVSKVPVFQYKPPAINYDPNTGQPKLANDKPPPEGPYESTFAYTPGLFVAGTSKAAITPIIKRFLGEEKGSLRATAGFTAAATEYRKPGIFFYANAPELLDKLDAAGRAREEPYESYLLSWLRITANQKALTALAGSVQFRDGGVSLIIGAKLDPARQSQLVDFFSGPPVKVDALYHARKPASFSATVNLPEKNRAAAVIGFLDAFAKAQGVLGRLPGDIVKDLEEKQKLPVRNGLLAKVRAITVIMPAKQELPKGAKAVPMFVLHFDDTAAAGAWDEFLPKLVADITGEKPAQPASETIDGAKVFSLPAAGSPWKSPVHYTRKGTVLVVGQDRKLVAAAVTPDAGASVAGDTGFPLPAGELALVGTLNLGVLFSLIELPATQGPPQLFNPFPRIEKGKLMAPEETLKEVDKARDAFLAAFGQLPPAVVTVRRAGNELKLEVFQPKVQNGGLTPIINAGVNCFDKLMNLRDPNSIPLERNIYGKW